MWETKHEHIMNIDNAATAIPKKAAKKPRFLYKAKNYCTVQQLVTICIAQRTC